MKENNNKNTLVAINLEHTQHIPANMHCDSLKVCTMQMSS